MEKTRPSSVAVVGWLLVIFSALGILASLGLHQQTMIKMQKLGGMDNNNYYYLAFASWIIYFVAGIFILKGANWARWLWLVGSISLSAYNYFALPKEQVLLGLTGSVIILAIFAVCLFNKKANAFFTCCSGSCSGGSCTGGANCSCGRCSK